MLQRLGEQTVFVVLRMGATVMTFGGLMAVASGIPLLSLSNQDGAAATFVATVFRLALVFIVAGAAAWFVLQVRLGLLPSERGDSTTAATAIGGWLILLTVTLIALPTWMIVQLRPLATLWQTAVELLLTSGVWDGLGGELSGIIAVPVIAVLSGPFLEVTAAGSFILGSGALLFLVAIHSSRFSRAFIVCLLLQSALVLASADLAAQGAAVGEYVEREWAASGEIATPADERILEEISQYVVVVRSSASTLVLTLVGYLVWVPAVVFGQRVRTTFPARAIPATLRETAPWKAGPSPDVSADARVAYYEDAAQHLLRSHTGVEGRWIDPTWVMILVVALVVWFVWVW